LNELNNKINELSTQLEQTKNTNNDYQNKVKELENELAQSKQQR